MGNIGDQKFGGRSGLVQIKTTVKHLLIRAIGAQPSVMVRVYEIGIPHVLSPEAQDGVRCLDDSSILLRSNAQKSNLALFPNARQFHLTPLLGGLYNAEYPNIPANSTGNGLLGLLN